MGEVTIHWEAIKPEYSLTVSGTVTSREVMIQLDIIVRVVIMITNDTNILFLIIPRL